ncbi:ABC transporter ATP-binding protein [Halorhabdus amylolytica]|uniref:ABC transporter ATP-binding protein n=1 Tax=Halorhabdus amylolytica TaxID=2559573 RepID=UPI0010AAD6C8|nr:ABC transporter ATP-binding protein [Halorhabdus amylolytica]
MLIETRNVWRRYTLGGEIVTALADVSFGVKPGEFVAVVGPSGSGKSTLLNLIGLLDTPDEGTVLVDDVAAETLSDGQRTELRRDTIGFIFQDFYLIPTLTARENVALPQLFTESATERNERAVALLSQFGLGDRTEHTPSELSGGQQQRVAIARSLINDPAVVLADEPTGNLDQNTGKTILGEFERITDDGTSVVAVTHDRLVTDFADRVVELVDGRVGDSTKATQHVS